VQRRDVLRLGVGGGAAGALAAFTACAPTSPASRVFAEGVASGLHSDTEVVLWTRVSPERAGGDFTVGWEVATDQGFSDVVASGASTASAATDHIVKVLVGGLGADQSYWYRFIHPAEGSPVGRARTMPAPGAATSSLKLAFASCQSFNSGWYTSWRDIAGRDLDAVLFLGDYIYEAFSINLLGAVRTGDPSAEARTLADYRAKYRIYRSDPDLRAAHAAHPFVPIWDDHEIVNDYDKDIFVSEPARAAAAYQAWFEYQPVWPISGTRIYRNLPWGSVGSIFMLDGRQYRDVHRPGAPLFGDRELTSFEAQVGRSLLGADQRQWLLDGLTAAEGSSTWKVIGNPVMISPIRTVDLDTPEARAADPSLPKHAGRYSNSGFDSWDGFVWERDLVLSHLADNSIDNTVFVTGDYHSFWQHTLTPDFDDETAPKVANEFAAGAISSAGGAVNENYMFVNAAWGPYEPGFNYIDGLRNGFGLLEANPSEMVVSYFAHSALSKYDLPVESARFTLAAGDPVPTTQVF
jgi:alkaline phosphatase D